MGEGTSWQKSMHRRRCRGLASGPVGVDATAMVGWTLLDRARGGDARLCSRARVGVRPRGLDTPSRKDDDGCDLGGPGRHRPHRRWRRSRALVGCRIGRAQVEAEAPAVLDGFLSSATSGDAGWADYVSPQFAASAPAIPLFGDAAAAELIELSVSAQAGPVSYGRVRLHARPHPTARTSPGPLSTSPTRSLSTGRRRPPRRRSSCGWHGRFTTATTSRRRLSTERPPRASVRGGSRRSPWRRPTSSTVGLSPPRPRTRRRSP